jgi:hypothetical protein
MATRNITLSLTSPSEGSVWDVSFSVDDATPIRNIVNFAITCPTNTGGNFSVPSTANADQVVNGYSSHSSTNGGTPATSAESDADSYVTWRSVLRNGQFPVSGKSLDVWGYNLYNDIMYSSKTWAQIGNGATYALNPRKWSLIYDYSARTAFVLSKGGTLTVSVV